MLTAYLQETQRLLWDTSQASMRPGDLTVWINKARVQLAGEAACCRVQATLALAISQRVYPFSAINVSGTAGIGGAFNVRTLWYSVGTGMKWIRPRNFAWFSLYALNNPVPQSGPPQVWSQQGQGVAGTIYVDPLPDIAYSLTGDAACYPVPLTSDATVEAIPVPWTDCVPFFAAYFALLSAQQNDAARGMYAMYETFMRRARAIATPEVLPTQYEQVPSPFRTNALAAAQQQADSGASP